MSGGGEGGFVGVGWSGWNTKNCFPKIEQSIKKVDINEKNTSSLCRAPDSFGDVDDKNY